MSIQTFKKVFEKILFGSFTSMESSVSKLAVRVFKEVSVQRDSYWSIFYAERNDDLCYVIKHYWCLEGSVDHTGFLKGCGKALGFV